MAKDDYPPIPSQMRRHRNRDDHATRRTTISHLEHEQSGRGLSLPFKVTQGLAQHVAAASRARGRLAELVAQTVRVLDRLVGTLSKKRRHRVRCVSDEHCPRTVGSLGSAGPRHEWVLEVDPQVKEPGRRRGHVHHLRWEVSLLESFDALALHLPRVPVWVRARPAPSPLLLPLPVAIVGAVAIVAVVVVAVAERGEGDHVEELPADPSVRGRERVAPVRAEPLPHLTFRRRRAAAAGSNPKLNAQT
mmetsp:Transcript_27309/g.55894  ORF Transcript_27309/g.55894 Transcript_27309/m.55894 type:complete len:247 (-) Transcript_27309:807-1547(-)